MDTLKQLQNKNPQIKLESVFDASFAAYGRVLEGAKADKAVAHARKIWKVEDKVEANISVPEFEADDDLKATVGNRVFGGMPFEVGWVRGRNDALTAVEWHQGSEAHVPLEDCILLVALATDIKWNPEPSIDSSTVRGFYCPKGTIVELFQWALHYAPVNVSRMTGFCNLFVLPRGTGNPLPFTPDKSKAENALLVATNIWFIEHKEGMKSGFYGPLAKINPLD